MSFFWGAAAAMGPAHGVAFTNKNVFDFGLGTGASATISFQNNGQLWSLHGNELNTNHSPEWLSSGTPGNYQIRATLSSGTAPNVGPALNTWHALSTTRSWGQSLGVGFGNRSCTLLCEIRDASTLAVLDSASIYLEVQTEL